MENSFFQEMKQSEIIKLRNKVKEYQNLLDSAQRCFDKQYQHLRYTIHDKNYQIKMLKETLIGYEQHMVTQKEDIVRQKKIFVKQKQEIKDLKKPLVHLFGDAFDQDFEIDVESNQDIEIEHLNASSASTIEP